MQGKVLIVDEIATNRIVMKVKLASAYYHVIQASSLAEAAKCAIKDAPDLIVCALNLPDGDAARLCSVLKHHPHAQHIPILAIGAPPFAETRLKALKEGVRDVLLKPVDDTLLLGRVRSLIRDHNTSADWRMRDDTCRALGLAEPAAEFGHAGHCMMVSADRTRVRPWLQALKQRMSSKLSHGTLAEVLSDVAGDPTPDVFVLVMPKDPNTSSAILRLIATLRASAGTRHAGVLVLQSTADAGLAANALDMGADDLMTDGFDAEELALRLNILLKRKRRDAQSRATIRSEANAAGHDPLTGLHNRRYAMPHLSQVAANAAATGRPLAVMVADLDYFKQVNDDYGHAAGDAVLVEVAERLNKGMRPSDMVARIGGEEFLIILPGTSPERAREMALQLCEHVGGTPFKLPGHASPISVTISIGLALGGLHPDPTRPKAIQAGADLLDQADKALYSAKVRGRNRVTLSRPAA